jgi:DNA repair exonuclease SbcCD ATPase subunit
MRITRLHLKDLKRHEELTIEPAPGLTVIRGPNESGKSAVQRAVELAFYGGEHAAAGERLRRWGSTPSAVPTVELAFEDDGVDGLVKRTFEVTAPVVEMTIGGEVVAAPDAVDARLAELLGIPSLAFYRSSAAVRHEELAHLDRDEAVFRERLSATISAADRPLRASMAELEATLAVLDGVGAAAPGPLRTVADEVARLSAEVERGEAELRQAATDQETLAAARTTLAEAEAQLDSDREHLATAEEAVRFLTQQRDAEARHDRFKRATALRDEIEVHEANHPTRIPLPVLREGVARLQILDKTIADLSAELADETDVSSFDIATPRSRWRALAIAAIILALAGVVGVLVTGAALLGLLAVAGLVCAALAVWQRRIVSDLRRQQQLREEQITRRLRGRSVIEQQLKDAQKAREAHLAGLGLADTSAAAELLAAEEHHVAAIQEMRGELKGLLGDPPPSEDVALLRDRAAADAEQARVALANLGEIGQDPERNRQAFATAVKDDEASRERAGADVAASLARVESGPADSDRVAAAVEALAVAQVDLALLERRRRVVEGTLTGLRDAERATMRSAAAFVEERMARDVETITAGRYRRVQVGESDLAVRVWSPEMGDWVDVRALSEGTLGQVYLAARLALVRQVVEDRRPPLVLDDPFITFDDERAARALEVIRGLAVDFQVLYLTTSDRYDAVAERVVVLPGPTEVDVAGADAST